MPDFGPDFITIYNESQQNSELRIFLFEEKFFQISIVRSFNMTQPPGAGVNCNGRPRVKRRISSCQGVVFPTGARIKREYW